MACHYGHLVLFHLMQDEKTALHVACASGHVELAATLLKHGANVNKEDEVRLLCVHGHGHIYNIEGPEPIVLKKFVPTVMTHCSRTCQFSHYSSKVMKAYKLCLYVQNC